MRPAASAYSVSAYLQPQFATPNTRCLIFYTYPLSFLQAKWFPLDPQTPPPPKKHKHKQTQNCPLQPSDARSVCLAPVFFQLTRWIITTPQVQKLPFWNGRGGEKRKTPIANETRASTKISLSLSLSLSLLFSREETAMQPRLEALNSNSFQTIFCKTVNQYKETILCKWRSSSSTIQWFSQRDAKALCI